MVKCVGPTRCLMRPWPRTSAGNTTLRAIAAERRADAIAAGRPQPDPVHRSAQQQTSRMLLLLSNDGTDRQTDGRTGVLIRE